MKNKFRKALLENELVLGAWLQIGHPAVAEIFASAGFDWICIDMEHGAIGLETMTNLFRTIDAYDCTPLVRIPLNDPIWIHRSLDAGARAIMIPMINSAEEAERAVSEAKYPPRGRRGFGYSRASMHGMKFYDYIESANEEIAVILQIEHKDAIDNLEEIVEVDGIDGLFIGPMDLTGSMGVTGQLDDPAVVAALDKFKKIAAEKNITIGTQVVRPNAESVKKTLAEGYRFLALGLDNVFLDESSKQVLKFAGR